MGVGVDHARHAIAEIHHLQPVEDGVHRLALFGNLVGLDENQVERVHFDHVDHAEHLLETGVG